MKVGAMVPLGKARHSRPPKRNGEMWPDHLSLKGGEISDSTRRGRAVAGLLRSYLAFENEPGGQPDSNHEDE